MGISETVGVVFIILKLTEVIDWSWWLVLLPFYGMWFIYILIFMFKEY